MPDLAETPGAVRKDLYDYLESEGLKITEPRHKMIRTMLIAHEMTTLAAEKRDRANAINALGNVKVSPKASTIQKRIADKQCPVCGLAMAQLTMTDDRVTYTTLECKHVYGVTFEYHA